MAKFFEGQKVKLVKDVSIGNDKYKAGHACSIVSILKDRSKENEIRYWVDGDTFYKDSQEYELPFTVTESQIENNESFEITRDMF